jgi:hypothetical protein
VPLSLSQKSRLAAEVLATYARVRWLLARNELPATVDRLRAREAREGPGSAAMPAFNRWRLATAIIRVLRLLPTDSRCLMRSLVMLAMLERRGVSTTLVIGVRVDPDFAAHAWIEEAGEPLLDSGDGAYPRLTTI